MRNEINIVYDSPSPDQYNNLRVEGGLMEKDKDGVKIGLKNSLFMVCVYNNENLIGMGRIGGDGGTFFHIVDIVVKPKFQGQGIGKRIMKELTNYLQRNAYPNSYVSLIADVPANHLYEQFGFQYTSPKANGMYKIY